MADQFIKEFKVKNRFLDFAETWHTLSLDEKKIGKKISWARKLSHGFKNRFRVFEIFI